MSEKINDIYEGIDVHLTSFWRFSAFPGFGSPICSRHAQNRLYKLRAGAKPGRVEEEEDGSEIGMPALKVPGRGGRLKAMDDGRV